MALASQLTGAGASFPFPIYAKWAKAYADETGVMVNYQSIGSGGGQQQIIAGTVDFGASDDPMNIQDIEKHHLFQFPAVIGGIVPVVNIEGIQAGDLVLSGQVLADIFEGKIKKWDDPAIVALNPDLALPHRTIIVVHRSDGSGTTFNFTDYLARVSASWAKNVGVGKAVKWPVGQAGKGNEGVSAYVRQIKNSIGYVEYAYAKQNRLAWTKMKNKSGSVVAPTVDSFSAAATHVDWLASPAMGAILNDPVGQDAWPMSAATFVLISKKRTDRSQDVLTFYNWAWTKGKEQAIALDYVPLPDSLIDLIHTQWKNQQTQ
nr:phosphate ABC transporter substrate-binding protein PstS [Basilea psittacipulmonis]